MQVTLEGTAASGTGLTSLLCHCFLCHAKSLSSLFCDDTPLVKDFNQLLPVVV